MTRLATGGGATPARRRRLAAWFLTLSLGSGIAGWAAGAQIVSSAETAAGRTPPDPSVLTATVEQRALHAEAITRGTLERSSAYAVAAWPPDDPAVGSVVTAMPLAVGGSLDEGALAAEIGGRPVIALAGAIPAFRDLRLGDEGVDVDQLRASLARLGLLAGADPGTFDRAVVTALEELYASLGYPPPDGGAEARTALASARVEHRAARAALHQLTSGHPEVPRSERLAAEAAVTAARNALAIADAGTAAATQQAARRHSLVAQDLHDARDQLAVARERLREAEEQGRPPAELDQLRREVDGLRAVVRDAEGAVLQAEQELEIAQLQRAAQLDAARAGLELAEQQLAELGTVPPPAAVELEAAEATLSQAEDALADAESAAAAFLPRSEVVFVPSLPRRVTDVLLRRGDSLEGPFAQVSGSELRIDATLPPASVASVQVGDVAIIDDVGTAVEFEATLISVAEAPVTEGEDAGRFAIRLVPVKPPPEQAIGLSLRVRLPIESTGESALIVPVTALNTAADGTSFVERLGSSGTDRIPVEVGLVAAGLAAVTPASRTGLAAGDEVVVGLVGSGG